jgi:hypothetical protein
MTTPKTIDLHITDRWKNRELQEQSVETYVHGIYAGSSPSSAPIHPRLVALNAHLTAMSHVIIDPKFTIFPKGGNVTPKTWRRDTSYLVKPSIDYQLALSNLLNDPQLFEESVREFRKSAEELRYQPLIDKVDAYLLLQFG